MPILQDTLVRLLVKCLIIIRHVTETLLVTRLDHGNGYATSIRHSGSVLCYPSG